MIYHCDCRHKPQDELHGSGQRVHNRCNSKSTGRFTAIRCTVCGKEKEVGEGENNG